MNSFLTKKFFLLSSLTFVITTLSATSVLADKEKTNFSTEKATGNWSGKRPSLFNDGFSFDIFYKVESWRNLSGGIKQGD